MERSGGFQIGNQPHKPLGWFSSKKFSRGGGGRNLLLTNFSVVFGPNVGEGEAKVSEKEKTASERFQDGLNDISTYGIRKVS